MIAIAIEIATTIEIATKGTYITPLSSESEARRRLHRRDKGLKRLELKWCKWCPHTAPSTRARRFEVPRVGILRRDQHRLHELHGSAHQALESLFVEVAMVTTALSPIEPCLISPQARCEGTVSFCEILARCVERRRGTAATHHQHALRNESVFLIALS